MLVNLCVPATRIGHCRGLADLRSRPPAIGLGQERANPQHGERGRPELKWKTKVNNKASLLGALTAPIVAVDVPTARGIGDVVFVAGKEGGVFAIDAGTGDLLWEWKPVRYGLPAEVRLQWERLLPERSERHADVRYAHGHPLHARRERSLYGLDMSSGKVRFGPAQFVTPFTKAWSLNLIDDTIHTTLAQGCGGALSGFYSMDIGARHRPVVRQMLLSNTITGGIWGRGGPIAGENGRVYGSTADGPFDPRAGDYSNVVVAASLDDLELVDHFVPKNHWELFRLDLDFGSASPVWFGWNGYNLLASARLRHI